MGTGYTRNDTANNIADGNIINAADFDGEYDAIEAAFNSSTGHTHDGTAGEGGAITVLGPSQELVASSSTLNPSVDLGLDLGSASLQFNDLYLGGTANISSLGGDLLVDTTNQLQFRDPELNIHSSVDGQLDIAADEVLKLTTPNIIATEDVSLQSDGAVINFGADDDVTLTHAADTGLNAGAANGFTFAIQTNDISVDNGNTLGKITFNAPLEDSGTDAILVGAAIEAEAEATFSASDNATALVFKTNESGAATERMRVKSDGDVLFTGTLANMSWSKADDSLDFGDAANIRLGAGNDLVLTHDATNSSITNVTGELFIQGDAITLRSDTGTEKYLEMDVDGAVSLYYDDVKKLETTADGVTITGNTNIGNLRADTNTISSTDTNGDINLSPDGTGTVVVNTDLDVDNINVDGNTISSTDFNGDINLSPNGTGSVVVNTDLDIDNININGNTINATNTGGPINVTTSSNGDISLDPNGLGVVSLGYNGSNKLVTSATGITVAGTASATEFSGITATLTGTATANTFSGVTATLTGTATAVTFSGQLAGTIASATTAVTQTQKDGSTKVATTAYVDAAATGIGADSESQSLALAIALG